MQPQCAFCPVKGGALKPAAVAPGAEPQWVHLFCSQWIPETYIKSGDTERMEPVQGVPNVGKPRRNLVCAVCKTKSGACIQCNHGFCTTGFHPMCARNAGLLMEMCGREGRPEVQLNAYCKRHMAEHRRPAKPQCPVAAPTPSLPPPPTGPPQAPAGGAEVKREKLENGERGGQPTAAAAAGPTPAAAERAEPSLRAGGAAKVEEGGGKGAATEEVACSFIERLPPQHLVTLLELLAFAHGKDAGELLKKTTSSRSGGGAKDKEAQIEEIKALTGDLVEAPAPSPGPNSRPAAAAAAIGEGLKALKAQFTSQGIMLDDKTFTRHWGRVETLQAMPPLPKYLDAGARETVHPHTRAIVRNCRAKFEGRLEGPDKAGAAALGASASLDGELKALEGQLDLVAEAPDDEITGELMAMQAELAQAMMENQTRCAGLLEDVQRKLPAERERSAKIKADSRFVDDYVSSIKEVKRAQKREKRAAEQKKALADMEAAVATSTRQQRGAAAQNKADKADGAAEDAPAPAQGPAGTPLLTDPLATRRPEEEALCAICSEGHSLPPNMIVFCERCDIAVHQKCYGISRVPDGEWLCWPCKLHEDAMLRSGKAPQEIRAPSWQRKSSPTTGRADTSAVDRLECALCPVRRGALKQTTDKRWVHVCCAMWHSEVQLHDTDNLVAVTGLEHIRAEKSQLSCTVCKQTKGAVVQCSFGNCRVAFHPLCARMAGYHMPIRDGAGGKAIVKQYCREHGSVMRSQGDAAPPKAPLKPKEDPLPKAAPKAKAKAKEPSKETAMRELEAKQASFAALRYMRRELEHLRLMCDRVVKREKVKKDLLKAEHECWRKRLESPALAMATEASMPPAPVAPAGPAQQKRGRGGGDGKIAKRPRTQRPRAEADRDSVTAPASVASAVQVPPPG